MLIGLTGYAETGKDTFADLLVANHGYIKAGFSDAIWNLALEINPRIWLGSVIPVRLRTLSRFYSYTRCKRFRGVRRYLQWLGTEAIRRHLGEGTWINTLMDNVRVIRESGRSVVVTNVRFPNEAEAIQDAGGIVALVHREGKGPVNDHASDAGLAFPAAEILINNSGSLLELAQQATAVHGFAAQRQLNQHNVPLRLYTEPELQPAN